MSIKLLLLIPNFVAYLVLRFLWVCVNWRWNWNSFPFCNRNTISQLFLRCSFIAAGGITLIFSVSYTSSAVKAGPQNNGANSWGPSSSCKVKIYILVPYCATKHIWLLVHDKRISWRTVKAVSRCKTWPNWTDTTVSNVCWTAHHCNSWRAKDQLDDTCYFISLILCSTCFGH